MEKMIPFSVEAESGVLGSILIDPEAIHEVLSIVKPGDFYRDAHRTIFKAMENLHAIHEPADFVTLCDELERHDDLDEIGGGSYLTSLVNQVPTSSNASYYANIVARKALYRRLIHAAGQIAAMAYSEDETVLAYAEEQIHAIGMGRGQQSVKSINDIMGEYFTRLETLYDAHVAGKKTLPGVPTGFTWLDRLLGGLQRTDLITLAARPAVGKTSFLLNLAAQAMGDAKTQGYNVLIFSLEMGSQQLAGRLLSMKTEIDQTRLRRGMLEEGEWGKVIKGIGELSEGRLWIDDTAAQSVGEMRSKARKVQTDHGLDVILVDYMQLMKAARVNGRAPENRVQEVSQISAELKAMAKELNIPVLALAQLSREVEKRTGKVPQLSDLRDSGTIEQDSDIVMFLHPPAEIPAGSDPYPVDVMVAKHRNGPVGVISLKFDPKRTKFTDIDFTQQGAAPMPEPMYEDYDYDEE